MSDFLEYKCPACGGKIEFNTERQKLSCPYCGTEFANEALEAFANDLGDTSTDNMSWSVTTQHFSEAEAAGMTVYKCKSCGGEIVGDDTLGATSCPFCDSPIVVGGKFADELKPDLVIPFKLDKRAAKEALMKHISSKKLVPKVFKGENHIDEIKGVYVPFWLFDAKAGARVRYKATKVKRYSDTEYNYKETSYYTVTRAGSLGFSEVPVNGSSKMDDVLMESVEPFSAKEGAAYSSAYLAGFMADKYDKASEDCITRANERIKTSTEQTFRNTVKGFDTVEVERSCINLENGKARYALCPVWLLNTTWKGKKFTFAVNGQTGKIVGDLPTDRAAFWEYLIGSTVASSGIALLVMWLISIM